MSVFNVKLNPRRELMGLIYYKRCGSIAMGDETFGGQREVRRQLLAIIERFRQRGAVSPEKAMTTEELGLPPKFEEAMRRRLGRLGIFVEVNGKYYLPEERLKQLEERGPARGGAWSPRKRIMTLRLVRLAAVALFALSLIHI